MPIVLATAEAATRLVVSLIEASTESPTASPYSPKFSLAKLEAVAKLPAARLNASNLLVAFSEEFLLGPVSLLEVEVEVEVELGRSLTFVTPGGKRP